VAGVGVYVAAGVNEGVVVRVGSVVGVAVGGHVGSGVAVEANGLGTYTTTGVLDLGRQADNMDKINTMKVTNPTDLRPMMEKFLIV
jgi:hypothetical protein